MVTAKSIETQSFYIEKFNEQDPIIRVEKKLGVETTVEDLRENARIYEELLQQGAAKFLVVCQVDCTSSKEMMAEMAKKSRSKFKKAEAIIIKNLANRLESNFYIQNFKPIHPIAIFNTEEAGLRWLNTFT